VFLIRRIHVMCFLRMDPAKRDAAEHVHDLHAERCPVARTIDKCVTISTSLEMEDGVA
jgi:uncharacterized OsmC-like protein